MNCISKELLLTGTNRVNIRGDCAYINMIPSGVVHVTVKNIVTDGPCAYFILCKSESDQDASITRLVSSSGKDSGENLRVEWNKNSEITLHKSGDGYDGYYKLYISALL